MSKQLRGQMDAANTEAVLAESQQPSSHGDFEERKLVYVITVILGSTLAVAYFLRSSFLPLLFAGRSWTLGHYVVISVCAVWAALNRGNVRWLMLLPIPATLVGSYYATLQSESLFKWLGWAALLAAVGPAFSGKLAQVFRDAAWRSTRGLLVFMSMGSVIWYLIGLAPIGKGAFTGLTAHCNVIGPLAGLTMIVAIATGIRRRSWVWAGIAVLSLAPCLLAGARAGVLGLIAGLFGVAFVYTYKRAKLVMLVCLGLGILLWNVFGERLMEDPFIQNLTDVLREKGTDNTREHLWQARWYEFTQHPWFGAGVGMAEGAGAEFLEYDKFNVEPGSSYLAVLSMGGGGRRNVNSHRAGVADPSYCAKLRGDFAC